MKLYILLTLIGILTAVAGIHGAPLGNGEEFIAFSVFHQHILVLIILSAHIRFKYAICK